MSYFILMGRRIPKQAITGFKFQNETDNIRPFLSIIMKKYLTDKEKEERMNYLTIHKCKNEDERKELKELCDWYFKDTPVLTMSFSLTEEDLRVTMERDVELSAVAGAVKNQHHKKKI